MDEKSLLQKYSLMISFVLPEGMLDFFEIMKIEETENDKPCHELDILYPKVLNIYLKERDNREGEELGLIPNGFTEPKEIHDYPVRSRKLVLHVQRRRYLDADGHNVILCHYPLAAEGTRLSVEYGAFFKVHDPPCGNEDQRTDTFAAMPQTLSYLTDGNCVPLQRQARKSDAQ